MALLPDVDPTFNVDFTKAPTPEAMASLCRAAGITYSRAGDRYYTNRFGKLASVGANIPVPSYDPITLIHRGIPIFGQRSTLLTNSEDFSSGYGGSAGVSLSASKEAPDGTLGVYNVTDDNASGPEYLSQSASISPTSQVYCLSAFVEKKSSTQICTVNMNGTGGGVDVSTTVQIDLSNGNIQEVSTIFSGSGVNSGNFGVIEYPDYYRVYLTRTTNTGNTSLLCRFYPAYGTALGNFTLATGSAHFWGIVCEQGDYPTDYIKRETAAAVRNTDVLIIEGDNFTDMYNPDQGTFLLEVSMRDDNVSQGVLAVQQVGSPGSRDFAILKDGASKSIDGAKNGIYKNLAETSEFTYTNATKFLFTGDSSGYRFHTNGSLTDSGGDGMMAAPGLLRIGAWTAGNNPLESYLKSIQYFPIKFSLEMGNLFSR